MGSHSQAAMAASFYMSSSCNWAILNPSSFSLNSMKFPLRTNYDACVIPSVKTSKYDVLRSKTRATLNEKDQIDSVSLLQQEGQLDSRIEESVKLLKKAAKTRKVPAEEVLSALSVIEKAKLDPSGFLETLGGTKSPGKTWMLMFTAEKQMARGRYFPLTAVQRFDAVAKRIENGVYFGKLGRLTFEGRFSWKNRILAFIFERIRIKIGFLKPLEFSLSQKENVEPGAKDPFFIWFYIDDEIAVARGRSGGTAFWCRCRRVTISDCFED